MKNARLIIGITVFLITTTGALAQGGPNISVAGGSANTKVTIRTGSKPSQTATVAPDSTGGLTLPSELQGPDKSHMQMREWDCDNGDVYIVPEGDPNPCPGKGRRGVLFWWDTGDNVTLHPQTIRPMSTSESAYDHLFASIDIAGGFNNINGYNPGLFRVGGDVGFQFAGILEAAPSFSYGYTGDATVLHFGSSGTGSTSFNSSLRSNEALLGGRVGVHPGPWSFTVFIGADVDHATLTDTSSFCGPTACSSSKTTSHLTTTNLMVGGRVSYDITDHFAVFAGVDHVHEQPSAGSGSTMPDRYNIDKNSASFGFKYYPRKHHKKRK